VLKDGRVVGIMSERDIIYCLARDGAAISTGRWSG
jgi:hypothetical protein